MGGGARTFDRNVEALAGLREGNARFTLSAKKRSKSSLKFVQAHHDAGAQQRTAGDVDDVVGVGSPVAEGNPLPR